jgi:type II secretory pathway pseudopilin PulG
MAAERSARGFSLVETVFVLGVGVSVTAMAVPQLLTGLDDYRAAGAARYMSTRLQRTRMEAIARSAAVAMQFVRGGGTYAYTEVVDGNRNGVLTREIESGIDRPLRPAERLSEQFTGVDFGTLPGLPPIDAGGTPPGDDPIRLGRADIATFTPLGTATAGTLYILGRGGAQYALRIFGETAKTRLLKFDRRAGKWRPL